MTDAHSDKILTIIKYAEEYDKYVYQYLKPFLEKKQSVTIMDYEEIAYSAISWFPLNISKKTEIVGTSINLNNFESETAQCHKLKEFIDKLNRDNTYDFKTHTMCGYSNTSYI